MNESVRGIRLREKFLGLFVFLCGLGIACLFIVAVSHVLAFFGATLGIDP